MPADNPAQTIATTVIGKFVLGISALAFIGYGLTSLLSPEIPARLAGIAITNADGLSLSEFCCVSLSSRFSKSTANTCPLFIVTLLF
jgi:hypothetical protein